MNAVDYDNSTPLHKAARNGRVAKVLIQNGAEIDDKLAASYKFLGQVKERLNLLRSGKRMGTTLMSNEEREWMWNLAFSLTIQHPAAAFKVYYKIRSFITFHGMFMADGYGEESSVDFEDYCRGYSS